MKLNNQETLEDEETLEDVLTESKYLTINESDNEFLMQKYKTIWNIINKVPHY